MYCTSTFGRYLPPSATAMSRPTRVLAFVLANGAGRGPGPSAAGQLLSAMPFANGHRIVDFVLSNLINSGVTSVYVVAQHRPLPLIAHLEDCWQGRFGAAGGFARWLLPFGGARTFAGSAAAVRDHIGLVEQHNPEVVAVFSADHVFRMDVRPMLAFHLAKGATASVAAVRVPLAQACAAGVIDTDAAARVRGFAPRPIDPVAIPGDPAHAFVSTQNHLFEPGALCRTLESCVGAGGSDFREHVLPWLARDPGAVVYDLHAQRMCCLRSSEDPCYWRDVGTPQAMQAAREDALGPFPRFDLDNPGWPMHKERRAYARSLSRMAEPSAEVVQRHPPLG